ncbi:hypothetical protein HYPSUDRAFT_1104079 [Hypholoma sublateritium FD-334 SS-4]|uniref:Uncharacterized protein n=1 Tax=Hypholoma sublateritium (strain FD-334 SS-4) TaxID=945553 RepID=A0A0D2P729_HYPSF|nr:hypothetical protein HYPSUDRAFT_1104079 [Hypholoma sublateritium FD-334 SS-4]
MLDYDDEDRFIRRGKEIFFYMAGQRVDAKADVCVMNDLDYLLLVQEDKMTPLQSLPSVQRQQSSDNPEPQLIAGAIAAYYQNNFRRTRVGLPALPVVFMPGIAMVGTAPVFYRIPVSP